MKKKWPPFGTFLDLLDIEEERERLEEAQEGDFWGEEDDWDESENDDKLTEEPIFYHQSTKDGRVYHETQPFINRFWGKNPKCPQCLKMDGDAK